MVGVWAETEVVGVGLLDKFEARLERAVEGTAARMFKGAVEPVEIAAALQREATSKRAVLGINRVVAPNIYTVELSAQDFERLVPYAETLTRELAETLVEYLVQQNWAIYGNVVVELSQQDDLSTGMFRVSSRATPTADGAAPRVPHATPAAGPVSASGGPHLVVEGSGIRIEVPVGTLVLGRGTAADADLVDNSVSRRHAEIRYDGEDATVTDLGSTNGTWVNADRVGRGEQAMLSNGDVLRLGSVSTVYRQEGR